VTVHHTISNKKHPVSHPVFYKCYCCVLFAAENVAGRVWHVVCWWHKQHQWAQVALMLVRTHNMF